MPGKQRSKYNMKKYFLLLLAIPLCSQAQKPAPLLFDMNWKPCEAGKARYAALIRKTDSGWYRTDYYLSTNSLQMSGLYADSACKIADGWFRYYYPGGNISSFGLMRQNKKQGMWLSFHNNGLMKDSSFYLDDSRTGISLAWHNNGFLADSVSRHEDGYAVHAGWFNNGNPSYAGRFMGKMMEGPWVFYHKNGHLAAKEVYVHDKITDAAYYNESGELQAKKLYETADAMFKGGEQAWRKFLSNKLIFPINYQLVNTEEMTVVVAALIDEDGNVADVWVDIPFKPPFDYEALRAFKKSPHWKPALAHNRRVAQIIRQPITFAQIQD